MANPEHISILDRGVKNWNAWRESNPLLRPDLSGFDFTEIKPIYNYDSSRNKHAEQLWRINLSETNLQRVILSKQDLFEANLSNSNLQNALLNDAILKYSDLRGANLRGANLKGARLTFADLRNADLTGAAIFGISASDAKLENAIQKNLVITPSSDPEIIVDNLEVAQSMYSFFRDHKKIRNVIKTMGQRAVLILGRFTRERKKILDAIAERLRQLGLLPIIFDFDPIPTRDYTETIITLTGLSKFIIADITEPRAVPQEAQAIIPNFKIPFISIIQKDELPWAMFEDFNRYDWVIGPISYYNKENIVNNLEKLVALAEKKTEALVESRAMRKSRTIISIEELNDMSNKNS
jgi:hypothetical protein